MRPETDSGRWAGLKKAADFLSCTAREGFPKPCAAGLPEIEASSLLDFLPLYVLPTSPRTGLGAVGLVPPAPGSVERAGLDLFR